MYGGDKDQYCSKERKKTRWVRCPHCNGRGDTWTTQCGNKCDAGYKCQNGVNDKWHT